MFIVPEPNDIFKIMHFVTMIMSSTRKSLALFSVKYSGSGPPLLLQHSETTHDDLNSQKTCNIQELLIIGCFSKRSSIPIG